MIIMYIIFHQMTLIYPLQVVTITAIIPYIHKNTQEISLYICKLLFNQRMNPSMQCTKNEFPYTIYVV